MTGIINIDQIEVANKANNIHLDNYLLAPKPHKANDIWRFSPIARLKQAKFEIAGQTQKTIHPYNKSDLLSKSFSPLFSSSKSVSRVVYQNEMVVESQMQDTVKYSKLDSFNNFHINNCGFADLALAKSDKIDYYEFCDKSSQLEITSNFVAAKKEQLANNTKQLHNQVFVFSVHKDCQLDIFLDFNILSTTTPNILFIFDLAKSASVNCYKVIDLAADSYNFISTWSNLASYANFNLSSFINASSGSYIKNENGLNLNGREANSNFALSTNSKDQSQIDASFIANHKAKATISNQDVRYLGNSDSTQSFIGKIFIDKNCPDSEGYQLLRGMNHAANPTINFLPALDINTDTVKCSHGSTISKPDLREVFYLQSRGISKQLANLLLSRGFILSAYDASRQNGLTENFEKILIERKYC